MPIHIMYVPGDAPRYEQVGPVTRHALEFYSELWMPYAFPQLTVVDGPDTGMEYPMLIMSAIGAADHDCSGCFKWKCHIIRWYISLLPSS